jgi:hypothetical protein
MQGNLTWWWLALLAEGLVVWGMIVSVFHPAVRFFELPCGWTWSLPFAGVLYGAMTVDSAMRYVAGLRVGWRDQ